jgi:hypothetical protein
MGDALFLHPSQSPSAVAIGQMLVKWEASFDFDDFICYRAIYPQ